MKHSILLAALLLAMANAHANGPPGPPVPSPETCAAQGGVPGANLIADGSFGTGSGAFGESAPAPGLGAQTTYTYASWVSYHPDDGEYVIVNATGPGSPWSTWHDQLLGHTTGAADDRFAVFNASIEPGTFYAQTFAVAPNTNFEVSFWVMNVNSNSNDLLLPNLATVIRRVGVDPVGGGIVVATTGDIPQANPPFWHQYAALFNSAGATQIEVRLDNNSSGGLGNDFALDDIVLAPCALPAGAVGGTLYYDANLDGALQAGEPGLPANIPVQIVDTQGTPDTGDDVIVATTQTDATGHYAFANIPVGANYIVHALVTDPNVPANVALHTPNDVPVSVTSGSQVATDFGFVSADVQILKQGPSHVGGGQPIVYTLTISNPGPTAADGASWSDPVPAEITAVSALCDNETGGAVCGPVQVVGNDASGTLPTLPVGGSVRITIQGTTPAAETMLSNTATVTPAPAIPDPDADNNTSTASTSTPVSLQSFEVD
ncbi:SdrD B-like domain-containing protein [Dokdonella sp.]|uniref:SdrD B-like domain-containing protein n=1 Tax=Dokdonella sp. TaxID=2291710 RepID=UPI001B12DD82|nr:SdrD B-like domain-containing protein [Dokdonella sp.]MBO9663835.1 DUF11 domain-containing protein [Dokdonella sp.]